MEEKDKKIFLGVGIIVLVALAFSGFGQITGRAITEPDSLTIFQEGKRLTVQVDYPTGMYGTGNNVIDMRMKKGSKGEDQTSKCDPDRGRVSRGNPKCRREIAIFDLRGDLWQSKERVVFSVRGTDTSTPYRIP